jgi:Fungal specific transcription factor domain
MLRKYIRFDNFLLHGFEFGFFLNPERFRSSILLASIPEQRPIPALLSTIHLLSVHVSGRDDLAAEENQLLSQSVRLTHLSLSVAHPQVILHTIQAQVLLAHYFFRTSRFLEGRYHLNAAVSLCIKGGLHRLRATRPTQPAVQFIGAVQVSPPTPQDTVEEGQMINGFWTVFILDKWWSACLNTTSLMTDDDSLGTQIDTPWPLDTEGYEQVS